MAEPEEEVEKIPSAFIVGTFELLDDVEDELEGPENIVDKFDVNVLK